MECLNASPGALPVPPCHLQRPPPSRVDGGEAGVFSCPPKTEKPAPPVGLSQTRGELSRSPLTLVLRSNLCLGNQKLSARFLPSRGAAMCLAIFFGGSGKATGDTSPPPGEKEVCKPEARGVWGQKSQPAGPIHSYRLSSKGR